MARVGFPPRRSQRSCISNIVVMPWRRKDSRSRTKMVGTLKSEAHLTNDFSITIQIFNKISFYSHQNSNAAIVTTFSHGMTLMLSWHAQALVAIQWAWNGLRKMKFPSNSNSEKKSLHVANWTLEQNVWHFAGDININHGRGVKSREISPARRKSKEALW